MQTLNPVGIAGGPDKAAFFDYIQEAHEMCPYSYVNEKCSTLGLRKINADETKLNTCIQNSWASGGKQSSATDLNQIFQQNSIEWQNYGTHLTPMILIDGEIFKGQ